MKHLYRALVATVLLSLAVTAVMLVFTPNTIPVHYNAQGQVTRMGSKYEELLFPLTSAVVALVFFVFAKTRKGETEERAVLIAALATNGTLQAVFLFFLLLAARFDGSVADLAGSSWRLTVILLGALLVVLGFVMPSVTEPNHMVGLRTKWSMSSPLAWRKSQRFGGYAAVGVGTLFVLASLFLDGVPLAVLAGVLLVAFLAASVLATYHFARTSAGAAGADGTEMKEENAGDKK